MNDHALVAAARRLRSAHIVYTETHTALSGAAEAFRLAEHELAEAGREHRILLMSTDDAELIEAPQ